MRRLFDRDFFVVKLFGFFFSGQFKGVGLRRSALFHAGDDIGAAYPVGLGEIGLRPTGGMVRMRVVEPDDVQLRCAGLALDTYQFTRIDVVAIMRRVAARVAAAHDAAHILHPFVVNLPQQHATALVRVSLFAVAAKLFELRFANL